MTAASFICQVQAADTPYVNICVMVPKTMPIMLVRVPYAKVYLLCLDTITHLDYCTLLQSLTVPLQGLLNAVVYGWTREDFVKTVTAERAPVVEEQAAQVTLQSEESHGDCDSPLLISVEKEDNK